MLFAGGAIVVGVAGLVAVQRWLPLLRDERSGGTTGAIAAMVLTLFALVLAFTVVTLDSGYGDATSNVRDEANALSQIVRDANVFPGPDRARIRAAVAAYVNEVRLREFPAMRDGDVDRSASDAADRLYAAVQALEPRTATQRGFFASATDALSRVTADRRERLAAVNSSLPQVFWILLLLTGMLSIAFMWIVRTHAMAVDLVMVSVIAILVGVGLLTTLLLEYPFSGSVAVTSSPYVEGTLGELSGVAR